MALVKCPECEKEISDKSKWCIHCGYPFDCNAPEGASGAEENEPKEAKGDIAVPGAAHGQSSEVLKWVFDLKRFVLNHKKKLIACVAGILAIIILIMIFKPLFSPKPTLEENLVGTWTSTKDESVGEVSVTFKYKNERLTGEWSFYDYEKAEWGRFSFEVKEHTDYTMTLLYEEGRLDVVTYSAQGDTLIFDGIKYKNDEKNIEDAEKSSYAHLIDDMEHPVWNDMFFGMSMDEVRKATDESIETTDYNAKNVIQTSVPSYFLDSYEQVISISNVRYTFTNDELSNIRVYFSFKYDSTSSQEKAFVDTLVAACNSEYGDYDYYGQPYSSNNISDTVVYAWEYGNSEAAVKVHDGFVDLEFSTTSYYINRSANE